MIFTVLVAEPWDFVSSDGKNILKVRYVTHEKDYFIFESVSNYEGYTRYLMFKNRSSSFSGVYGVAQIGESIEHIDESSLQLDFIVSMKEDEVNRFLTWLNENHKDVFLTLQEVIRYQMTCSRHFFMIFVVKIAIIHSILQRIGVICTRLDPLTE